MADTARAARPTLDEVLEELRTLKAMIPMGANPDMALVSGGLLEVEEAIAFSKLSKSELYLRLKDNTLRSVHYGKRRLIPRLALLELLARHLTEPATV